MGKKHDMKRTGSILALVLAGILWGGSFVVVKDALEYMTPAWQLALRLVIASVPALLLSVIFRNRWNKQVIKRSMLLGIPFFTALILQNMGMQYVSASKSGFLTTTYVAFIPLISIFVLHRKCSKIQLLAATICMAGAALLSCQDSLIPKPGDLLVLGCGFMYAVHILVADTYKDEDSLLMHLGQILTATVLSVIAAFVLEPLPSQISTGCFAGLLYCGIMEVFLCFFLQIVGQKHTPATLAGILLSMEGMYGALFAYLFLKEQMTGGMWAGCILIFLSAVIGNL